ncbi:hypothetical protein GCM10009555_017260 [Acrocarpospora macrocephala]|uniref:Uncharacterized protein n=2 Tax=Acrocarpospora macrocephala TaxID=150177 RepID=A0A5M3WF07_9ACTN|nr:hypothetical protein Amac_009810 [Acrocarpospora macrocephala]
MLRRLLHRVGRRGASLLFLALLDLVYAVGLLTAPPETRESDSFVFLTGIMPLEVWAGAWALVGCLCLVYAFSLRDRVAFIAASLLKAVWANVYLVGWTAEEIPRGYVSAAVWLAFAGFIQVIAGWRENWER